MEHFFGKKENDELLVGKEDEHHLLSVLHRHKGDELEVVTESGLYLGRIEEVSPLKIVVVHRIEPNRELKKELVLAFALLKGGHDELVLQKGTELGVKAFIPFISERTIIRLEEKEKAKRLERYRKIVKGASEQSRREIVPTIDKIVTYKELLSLDAAHRYLAYENSEDLSLLEELSSIKEGEKTIVIIGPEGGFSPHEVDEAGKRGWKIISLGKRILRAESASIYFASIFSFLAEQ